MGCGTIARAGVGLVSLEQLSRPGPGRRRRDIPDQRHRWPPLPSRGQHSGRMAAREHRPCRTRHHLRTCDLELGQEVRVNVLLIPGEKLRSDLEPNATLNSETLLLTPVCNPSLGSRRDSGNRARTSASGRHLLSVTACQQRPARRLICQSRQAIRLHSTCRFRRPR